MNRAVGRAARLRQIENLLFRQPRGLKVIEIAKACGVNRRTIYRDIEVLEESGVPIWQDNGTYGIVRDSYLAVVRLRFHEAMALYIAARLLSRHSDEHNPHIISALNKIATAFPEPLAEQVAQTADVIRDRPVNEFFVHVLEIIANAWAEQTKVRIGYRSRSSDEVKERLVSPYAIEPSSTGGHYLVGFDDSAQATRTFKLERVAHVESTREPFFMPPSFDLTEHFSHAWGIMAGGEPETVVLHFSAGVAGFITERIWHPSQNLVHHNDGSIEMTIVVADTREMRPWIRSWGSEVEVLQPASLRAEIRQDAKRLSNLYEPSTS